MGLQNKISSFQAGLRRRLFDYSISLSGSSTKVIRLKSIKDQYGNEEVSVINDEVIELDIEMPPELPLSRLRSSVTEAVTQTQSVFFYDVLPIEGFSKFDDNIERGDILIKKFFMDTDPNNFKILVLRVSEVVGDFPQGKLVRKKFNLAPHNIALSQEVQDLITKYTERTFYE